MYFRANVKRYFLDRKGVLQRVKKRRRLAMMRVGAFIRTTARRSMRVRKGPSAPGTPPSAHLRHLKDGVFFTYDANSDTVVCGPVKAPALGYDVPGVLEAGGRVSLEMVKLTWSDAKAGGRFSPAAWHTDHPEQIIERKRITFSIARRPYMGPAKVEAFDEIPKYITDLL